MDLLIHLNEVERNILIASIIGDGEITKIYQGSRRKNNSYREHFGVKQLEYREWKANQLPEYLYITEKSHCLRSKSSPLFTSLYPFFYDQNGEKHIPLDLLNYCTSFYFLMVLYLDDGSLLISKRINHRNKKVYIMPAISFYLQCYKKEELDQLKSFIMKTFGYNLKINKRKDGQGYILKMTKTQEVYRFLIEVKRTMNNCKSMRYKFDWKYRFNCEREKVRMDFPDFEVIESDSSRYQNYTEIDIKKLIHLKLKGKTDKEIATYLNRTYWSVVYKVKDLRKNGLL